MVLVPLTPIERRVLRLLSKGYTNEEAAQKLRISLALVQTHIVNVCGKVFPLKANLRIREAIQAKLLS